MRKFIVLFLSALSIANNSNGHNNQSGKFNFDFEQIVNAMPEQWMSSGSEKYILGVDDQNSNNGKYSAFIEYNPDVEPNFGVLVLEIPGSYEGRQITLTGYIKTESVSDGYAGLWMRLDPNVAFDNMHDRGVVGTTDWNQYSITLDLDPAKTKQIVVGGLLVGKGKMWMDNLKVTIDGKDIQDL